MSYDCDICIIGSGAGGSPIAYELSKAGHSVIVLEKGSWYTEKDFSKDELACCSRSVYSSNLQNEFHLLEEKIENEWKSTSTFDSGRDFWNGNCVGGSSNFMSGYFHRLKPKDFRLLSEFGSIKGANIVDWPISYKDLEPYYTKVEEVVGISGKVKQHKFLEPRSTPDFPFPPLKENLISKFIDKAARELNFNPIPTPRAIISKPVKNRGVCYYSNYCGSYPCSSGAKGSARAALLNKAVKTGNCTILPNSFVYKLNCLNKNKISSANYYDKKGNRKKITAKIFVVSCQAIETSRLLLMSANSYHPQGLGNQSGELGKNLIFSAGGSGGGTILYKDYPEEIKIPGLFVNRALQDWYFIGEEKGGVIDFLFSHPNPIRRAKKLMWEEGGLLWGKKLKDKLKKNFTQGKDLRFEVFNDWLPTDNCFVSLGKKKDKWSNPVAKIRISGHEHDLKIANFLAQKAIAVLEQMKLKDIYSSVSSNPPPNLVAGGCRFGTNPNNSILDPDCRSHSVYNLFVSDASFMPTGGSVPYTWTIYANSFRIADKIKKQV